MKNFDAARISFLSEMSAKLKGRDAQEIAYFNYHTWARAKQYTLGYELGDPIYLVLDNSIIQDYKHQRNDPKRALRALAYTAFCRFVSGWSDRETHLAISPVAIYEHLGRRVPDSESSAWDAYIELKQLLSDTKRLLYTIKFDSPNKLLKALRDVDADAKFLEQYAKKIDEDDWNYDLSTPFGIRIPISIATDAIPDNLPLKYFDPLYVKDLFSSRVEQLIIEQSQGNPNAQPISSGEFSEDLAALNEFNKKGFLTGLGDIDIYQICDVRRQYRQSRGYVFLGQTVDDDLLKVLSKCHTYSEHVSIEGGHPDLDNQVDNMLNIMFSNPFAAQDERARQIQPKFIEFLDILKSLSNGIGTEPQGAASQ